jgi:hypothetical protein
MGSLELSFDGYREREAHATVTFEPLNVEAQRVNAHLAVSSNGARYVFWITPDDYRVTVLLSVGEDHVVYVPRVLSFQPGSTHRLRYGSSFSVRMNLLDWFPGSLRLWFDVVDDRENYLLQFPQREAKLKLWQDGRAVYDGPGVRGQDLRAFTIDRDWGDMRNRRPATYEYTASSKVVGQLSLRGAIPPDQKRLWDFLPTTFSSPLMVVRFRDANAGSGEKLAQMLEQAYTWLCENYAGTVQPSDRGYFEVISAMPVGAAAAGSGGIIALHVYAGYDAHVVSYGRDARVLFHELGHLYQGSPPHNQAKGMGGDICESQATAVSDACVRALFGERQHHAMRQMVSRLFFDFLAGRAAELPGPNRHEFINHYIQARYGQRVIRAFFRAMYASQGNCEQILLSADFLKTEHERSAALYSFLCGQNLAWLFRWAGFQVSDENIARAMTHFKERGAVAPMN